MKQLSSLLLFILSAAVFFFHGICSGAPVCDRVSRLARNVSLIVETERSRDSTEAADLFLVPFKDEIEQVARKRKLPPALLAAFIQEESQFDPFAVRTEPSYLRKQKVIAEARAWSRLHGGIPTFQTELFFRSTSMGLMQPMGQVAREQGFNARFLCELITPYNSIDEGAKHLLSKLKKYPRDTLSAISAYNQGNNRKRHGVFLNARYVYRVTVAWKIYEPLFHHSQFFNENIYTHPQTTCRYSPEYFFRRTDSGTLAQRMFSWADRNSNKRSQPDDGKIRLPQSGLGSGRNKDSPRTSIGAGKGKQNHEKSEVKSPGSGLTTSHIGLFTLLGLGGVFLAFGYYANLSRHCYDLPQSVDKRVHSELTAELTKTKRNREIYGERFISRDA